MKKELRMKVWDRYNKHCAYCGKELEYKDMQVDHYMPKHAFGKNGIIAGRHINDDENLMPSCRRCNHYKRGDWPEQFRKKMTTLHERILKQYINKVALDYGIITVKPFSGEFYFEQFEGHDYWKHFFPDKKQKEN